jgi:hypothetical protein
MKRGFWAAMAAVSFFLAACNSNGSLSGTRTITMSTTTDTASIQRGRSSYDALSAAGFHYHFSGRLSNLNVTSVAGRTSITGHAGPGDLVNVALEQIPNNIFSFGPGKTPSFAQPVECADCVSGGGSAPPRAQQTNPPNYGGCSGAGGATWYNEGTGEGGCLGPGASRGFPCGSWSWSSPGHGRFHSYDGSFDADGWTFISVNPDGASCHLGY